MKNSLEITLDDFRGPLDLLLHLIEKNKVDIYDIPIVEITDQYIEFIDNADDKLGIASEFIVTAATLISIKTKMLLPKHEEEDDPRTELIEQLLEYKYFKRVSEELHELEKEGNKTIVKPSNIPPEVLKYEYKPNVEELFSNTNINELESIFKDLLKRFDERIDKVRSGFDRVIDDRWTISDRINFLRIYAKEKTKFKFSELVNDSVSKLQIVVTFLALLEMIKIGELRIRQEVALSDINIEVNCGK